MDRKDKGLQTPSKYLIHYKSKYIEIINTKTKGSLEFNIEGEDELNGLYSLNTIYKGGKLIRKVESEHRTQLISFEIPLDHNDLIIEVSNFYKANCEVENDGIIGLVNGNLEFIKDENVFIEGNPTMAGFTDENKTKFILAPNYGELTSHWDIVENKYYKGIDIQKGHENYAKFIVFSNNESPIRMLCQPHGYNATFTIASHADRSNVNVTKAVFYGSNLEKSPDYKKKGLIGYGIKGTLSVFAAAEDLKYTKNNLVPEIKSWLYSILKGNLKKQTLSFLTFLMRFIQLNIFKKLPCIHDSLSNPKFKELMDDAYRNGIEIVPHTMTLYEDDRNRFKKYLPIFHKNYKSTNFIDHYLFQHNESSGLHSSGNKPKSRFYVMDLLQKYDYKYAWSYQDTSSHNIVKDQIFTEHFQFPRHLVYQNKKLILPNGEMIWQYKCTNRLLHGLISNYEDPTFFLKELIRNGGYCSDHNYFLGTFGYLYLQDNKDFKIHPGLDKFLSFLKDKKDSGEIWNPTQSELNEYMIKLMNINLIKIGLNKYEAISQNDEPVNVSFKIKGKLRSVIINEKHAKSKINDDGFIFWSNFKKGINTIEIL